MLFTLILIPAISMHLLSDLANRVSLLKNGAKKRILAIHANGKSA